MTRTRIVAVGSYAPPRIVTNNELEKLMDTSDEWIQQRTGIRERRWADPGETVTGMAVKAAHIALKKANLGVDDIDAVIFSTLFPDLVFPGAGCTLQDQLGFKKEVPALDVRNQCSGFLYALSVADAWIRAGMYKRILIATSELHNSSINKTPAGRDMGVLFGDAASCTIVEATENKTHILDLHLASEGKYADKLGLQNPSPNNFPRLPPSTGDDPTYYPNMDGKFVFKHAVHRMCESLQHITKKNGLSLHDLDFIIPHQANMRINQMLLKELGVPENKTHFTIDRFGNTTSVTIPLTLDEAWSQKKIKDGDLVAFVAFGSGFTWGSALVRF